MAVGLLKGFSRGCLASVLLSAAQVRAPEAYRVAREAAVSTAQGFLFDVFASMRQRSKEAPQLHVRQHLDVHHRERMNDTQREVVYVGFPSTVFGHVAPLHVVSGAHIQPDAGGRRLKSSSAKTGEM